MHVAARCASAKTSFLTFVKARSSNSVMLTSYSERELSLKHIDIGDVARDYGMRNKGDYRVTRGNFAGGLSGVAASPCPRSIMKL